MVKKTHLIRCKYFQSLPFLNVRSAVKMGNLNPYYNESFVFIVEQEQLRVSVNLFLIFILHIIIQRVSMEMVILRIVIQRVKLEIAILCIVIQSVSLEIAILHIVIQRVNLEIAILHIVIQRVNLEIVILHIVIQRVSLEITILHIVIQRVSLEMVIADYDRIGSSDPIGRVELGYNRKGNLSMQTKSLGHIQWQISLFNYTYNSPPLFGLQLCINICIL